MLTGRPILIAAALASTLCLAACGDDHSSGASQRTTGKVEEGVGKVIGDPSLKREGQKDQVVGGVKDAAHDVKGAVKDATH